MTPDNTSRDATARDSIARNERSTRTISQVREVRERATDEIDQIASEHAPRNQVSVLYFLLGALFFAIGVYLIIADPNTYGGRRVAPSFSPTFNNDRSDTNNGNFSITERSAPPTVAAPVAPSAPVPRYTPTAPGPAPALATPRAPVGPGPAPGPTNLAFESGFLDNLTRTALAAGISRPTVDRAMNTISEPNQDAVDRALEQPELTRATGEYITQRMTADRIDAGRRKLIENATLLAAIERRYGVDRHILAAIWGLETNYSVDLGNRPVVNSLVALTSADTRRQQYWRDELINTLTLIDKGDLPTEDRLRGSWTGAIGHTMLTPSNLQKYGVDFDNNGRVDVINSLPDALATTANMLKSNGWVAGRGWGREVTVPANFDLSLASGQVNKTVAGWQMIGIRAMSGLIPADDTPTWQLILPAGASGPAFLVSQNFTALLKSNRAVAYALAVGLLSDRLAGGGPISATWPVDDIALSSTEFTDMQRLLLSQGFDPGVLDGIIGDRTQDAIRAYQRARNLPADGHPSLTLLRRLRAERRN